MDRSKALQTLVRFEQPLDAILSLLRSYEWDSDRPLITLDRQTIRHILERYIAGELSEQDIDDWANAVEVRDDICYEENYEELIDDLITQMSNPLLYEPLTQEKASMWLSHLE